MRPVRSDWFTPPAEVDIDLTPLEAFPSARSDAMLFCTLLADAMVDRWCHRAAVDLGLEPGVAGPAVPVDVAADRRSIWSWVVRRLLQRGWATLEGGGLEGRGDDGRGDGPRPVLAAAPSEDALEAALSEARGRDDAAAMVELFDLAGAGYPDVLRGTRDGEDVLLGRASLALWERYFSNENAQYAAINDITAHVVARLVTGPDRSPDSSPDASPDDGRLDVLEVGGGFGSAAERVLAALGDRVGDYLFTERVPFFLAKARPKLVDRFGHHDGLAFLKLDIEQPLGDQKVAAESVDVVVAVNVLHAVDDLENALANLKGALRPGGRLVLGEAIRMTPDHAVAVEFPFQLTRPFREFTPITPHRAEGGFLCYDAWEPILSAAGFENVRLTPEPSSVAHLDPAFCLAVAEATAP